MARRWFSRVGCTIESEEVKLIARDFTSGTFNGQRILTDLDLPGSTSQTVTVTNTATLDTGAITTMTVRGVSTSSVALLVAKSGKQVALVIPAFSLTAATGSPTSIILTGTGALPTAYRPANPFSAIVPASNNGTKGSALLIVSTGGVVSWQLWGSTSTFTPPTLSSYDVEINFLTA